MEGLTALTPAEAEPFDAQGRLGRRRPCQGSKLKPGRLPPPATADFSYIWTATISLLRRLTRFCSSFSQVSSSTLG